MGDFEKIFNSLSREQDPNTIFNEFLDYSIDINLLTLEDNGLNFDGREKEYYEMFTAWINITNDKLQSDDGHGWYDYLGEFYESIIQSKYKAGTRGQFFTPGNVCEVLSELSLTTNDKVCTINDDCCGSGRLLLAGHTKKPEAIIIASDLDSMACKMCVLNMYIHGCRGIVLNQNSLERTFYTGWKVNEYLGYGFNIPHIQEIKHIGECDSFIGLKNNKVQNELKESTETVNTINDESVQTTLI